MNLIINRLKSSKYKDVTMGVMNYGDFWCCSVELPWLDNETNISCIPAATGYIGEKGFNSKGKPVINIINVHGRTEIQIHIENFVQNLMGCIAVGDGFKFIDNDNKLDLTNSAKTLKKLMDLLPEKFGIEIHQD